MIAEAGVRRRIVGLVQRGTERLPRRLLEPLVFVRIGLCLVLLFRQEDLLRGVIELEHHSWGPGPEFGSHSLARVYPSLSRPLLPGLDALLPYSDRLCRLRLVLTCLLLVGVLPRLNALLLFLVSFSLFFADGFRYLHHLLILYVSVLIFALPHQEDKALAPPDGDATPAALPLALLTLRRHVQVVYFAAAIAKGADTWLSGATLRALHENAFASGAVMEAAVGSVGYQGLAWGAFLGELAVPLMLPFKRTRLLAVVIAFFLHGFIHATILVSTFGITMLVLLGAFLPTVAEWRRRSARRRILLAWTLALASPLTARALSTSVGSYTMFTRLAFYELRLEVDGSPYSRHQLAQHLGRDGARIVHLAGGRGIGEANLEILRRSLPSMGRLLCTLSPGAKQTSLRLITEPIFGGAKHAVNARISCSK
jgi:hypothetical protein